MIAEKPEAHIGILQRDAVRALLPASGELVLAALLHDPNA
jgi:hypothetical protein